MKSLSFAILLLLTGLAPVQPAAAQALWQGVRSGMSVVEVQGLRPAARPSDGQPVLGRQERLLESGVTIAGHRWDARYYFGPDALALIVMTPSRDVAASAYEAMFESVVRELGEQLGQPFTCAYGPFVGKQECDWRDAGRRVAVQLVTGLNAPLLELSYTPLGR